jgi:hypothetical protein
MDCSWWELSIFSVESHSASSISSVSTSAIGDLPFASASPCHLRTDIQQQIQPPERRRTRTKAKNNKPRTNTAPTTTNIKNSPLTAPSSTKRWSLLPAKCVPTTAISGRYVSRKEGAQRANHSKQRQSAIQASMYTWIDEEEVETDKNIAF